MKNATNTMIFPQELVDGLISSFAEDTIKLNRLSSPLSNVNISLNEGDDPEN